MARHDDQDLKHLRRAVAIARLGVGTVEPNPPVGCVVAQAGESVAEGWHKAFGGDHAEVAALRLAGEQARGSTLYVSLEPCSRHGKTPPCTERIVAAGVRRVVFAAQDPHPRERGRGSAWLADQGLDVVGPVAEVEAEAEPLLRRFVAALGRDRPWTMLKWAMSLDGRIAPDEGRGGVISGPQARLWAHVLRGRVDAVAVGVNTVLVDDPDLTCRIEGGPPDGRPQPRRIVFDTALRTPPTSRLARSAREVPVIVYCAEDADAENERRLVEQGCQVVRVPSAWERIDLAEALAHLHAEGVRRLLVEGGAHVHGTLLKTRQADQVAAFVAPLVLGGDRAPAAVAGTGVVDVADGIRLEDVAWRKLGDDLHLTGFLPPSTA